MLKVGSKIGEGEIFSSKKEVKEYVEPLISFPLYIKKKLLFYMFFKYVSGALIVETHLLHIRCKQSNRNLENNSKNKGKSN